MKAQEGTTACVPSDAYPRGVGLRQRMGDRGDEWMGTEAAEGGWGIRLGQRGGSTGLGPQLNDEDADG